MIGLCVLVPIKRPFEKKKLKKQQQQQRRRKKETVLLTLVHITYSQLENNNDFCFLVSNEHDHVSSALGLSQSLSII